MTIIASKPHIKDWTPYDDGTCRVGIVCPFGGGFHEITIPLTVWHDWVAWLKHDGPYVNLIILIGGDKAEMLISGTCPDCWAKAFPPEED